MARIIFVDLIVIPLPMIGLAIFRDRLSILQCKSGVKLEEIMNDLLSHLGFMDGIDVSIIVIRVYFREHIFSPLCRDVQRKSRLESTLCASPFAAKTPFRVCIFEDSLTVFCLMLSGTFRGFWKTLREFGKIAEEIIIHGFSEIFETNLHYFNSGDAFAAFYAS